MYCKPPDHYLSQPVKRITEERFFEMLEVLPPSYWRHIGGFECFQLCELTDGNITQAFGRLEGNYLEMYVVYGTSPGDIWERALKFLLDEK